MTPVIWEMRKVGVRGERVRPEGQSVTLSLRASCACRELGTAAAAPSSPSGKAISRGREGEGAVVQGPELGAPGPGPSPQPGSQGTRGTPTPRCLCVCISVCIDGKA